MKRPPVMRACCGAGLVLFAALSACNREPRASVPVEAAVAVPDRAPDPKDASTPVAVSSAKPELLFQPSLTRKGADLTQQGTGFIVKSGDRLFGITSAQFIGTYGPAVTRIDLHGVRDGAKLASVTQSWGRPGAGGVIDPILDLGDDLLVLPLAQLPGQLQPVPLRSGAWAQVGDKVWLPDKDPGDNSGYTRVAGEVIAASPFQIRVRLERKIELVSQSGSPVLFAQDGALAGLVSRDAAGAEQTELLLTPAHYVETAVQREQSTFPLQAVAGGSRAGASTKLSFGWRAGSAMRIEKRVQKRKDGVPEPALRINYNEAVAQHPEGLRISKRDFRILTPLPPAELALAEKLANAVAPMVVDRAGAFLRLEDTADIMNMMLDMTAQGDAERRARMAQLLTDDMLAADAKAEWSHQLESWAGISMELGEVYVRDYEAPSALTGEPVATRMYAMASQRTACTPDDKQRSCVALWSLIEPNVEALTASARRALLEATPVAKRAEAVAALQNFKVDSKSRVLLVVDPKTLLPYSYQYEQWNQVPGEPSQYEILDEQLARE